MQRMGTETTFELSQHSSSHGKRTASTNSSLLDAYDEEIGLKKKKTVSFTSRIWDATAVELKTIRQRANFKTFWVLHYVIMGIIGLICFHFVDGIAPLDAFFMGVSAVTGTALSTVSMSEFSGISIALISFLTIVGCATFMLVPMLLIRRYHFGELRRKVNEKRDVGELLPISMLSPEQQAIIQEYEIMDDALGSLAIIITMYFTGWIILGSLFLWHVMSLFPEQPELLEREFSISDSAFFLATSGMTNSGFSITTDSLAGLNEHPSVYLTIGLLIVAGNTGIPIFLRTFVEMIALSQRYAFKWFPHMYNSTDALRHMTALQYILDHPRRLTTHLFSRIQTGVLSGLILLLISIQFFFYLVSTMSRREALKMYSPGQLAGMGFFQTLSVRTAGFTIMDLRTLNEGLLFIYMIMMYMAAFPFVTTLRESEEEVASSRSKYQKQSLKQIVENATGIETPSPRALKAEAKQAAESAAARACGLAAESRTTRLARRFGQKMRRAVTRINETALHVLPVNEEKREEIREVERGLNPHEIGKRFTNTFLLRHTFFLLLAIVLMAYTEDAYMSNHPQVMNVFYLMFEIVSAYGNVGLTVGVVGQTYGLSGLFTVPGKLIIIVIMLLGKHRGLPSSTDEVIDCTFEEYRVACGYMEDDTPEFALVDKVFSPLFVIPEMILESGESSPMVSTQPPATPSIFVDQSGLTDVNLGIEDIPHTSHHGFDDL